MGRRKILAAAVFAGYAGTVYGANWALTTWPEGLPVWPGLAAPAGVYAAGLALGLRDALHHLAGRRAVVAAIAVGALMSLLLPQGSWLIAGASAVAFTGSEGLDTWVWEKLRGRSAYLALTLSNTVGLVIDTTVFLLIAFQSLGFFWGQVVGKAWMTVLALAVLWGIRNRRAFVAWFTNRRWVRRAA